MKLTPQEFISEVIEQLQGSWRYRWQAVVITWVICAVGWLVVYATPDIYKASARVHIDTESLLKPLMQGLTAQQNTLNEVQVVSRALLTRPNLEKVARETDLALRARSSDDFDHMITSLQDRVHVRGGLDNIFTIEYEDSNREMARKMVAAILDTFVEGTIGAQGDDSEITGRALSGEIEEHVRRLDVAEAALAEFKKQNVGYMPGESGDYYSQLQKALSAVSSGEAEVRQLAERRDELKRQVEGEEPVFGIVSHGGGAPACQEGGRISELQGQLSALLVNFTAKHPRVVALNEQIAALEQRCKESSKGVSVNAPAPGDELEVNPVYQNLRLQLSNTEVQLVEVRGHLKTNQAIVARLRADVDKIAQVETQLKQLNRDYDVVQARHKELLRRWEDFQAKKRLDPVTRSEVFQKIDPPFALPEPVAPHRPLLLGAVLVFALGLGGAFAVGMNQVRPVYWSRRRLRLAAGLPVLGAITMLVDPAGQRRSRSEALVWASSYAVLLVLTGGAVVFASRGSELVRGLINGVIA